MMKKITTYLLTVVAMACGGMAQANPNGVSAKEFLTLNRKLLPPMQVVIQSALDASNLETIPLHQMKKRARRSAFLPRVRLRMDYDLDAYNNWEFTEDARVYAQSNQTKQDRWERIGYGDRLSYGAYAEWDLSTLVWEKFDHQLGEKYAKQAGLKRRRIVEVSKRYAILKSLLPMDENEAVASSDIADVLENAIYLDAVTDFMFSKLIKQAAAEAEAAEIAAIDQVMGPDMEEADYSAEPETQAESTSDEDAAAAPQAPPATAPESNPDQSQTPEKADMLDFLNSL